jgi:hypothetical protein
LTAARGLLKLCQVKKVCPTDYELDLEEVKQTPAYQQIAKGLDRIASHLERAAEDIAFAQTSRLTIVPTVTRIRPREFCTGVSG